MSISGTEESMRRKTYLNFTSVFPDFPSPSVLSGTSNKTFLMKMECLLLGSIGAEVAIMFEQLDNK